MLMPKKVKYRKQQRGRKPGAEASWHSGILD
jgi:ribosomal protein L16/L10AE